ncbi:molybdopterin-binding protein [Acetobacteraceae bacterium KSS8]|uniref:Molybdopterin-binding protein n=1 Tax=Endosaccharibacter trunci TaxID=2812733 RepID=A0ABT1W9S9_9PROT|nr:molybdopterin-binding protein [Acetobacteraceae bacterium KSS8]
MSNPPSPVPAPIAAILVIGNEILSGRTQDINVQFLARRLGALGIAVREVRVIPDVADTIIGTVNELRARFDHVFTTGGIGPTHDDITSPCVAEAFGVPWEPHDESMRQLEALFGPGEFNAARRRMATLPRGAVPIPNSVSVAPGFTIGNVHVMAGVPRIMQAMFDALEPSLGRFEPVRMVAVHAERLGEGALAEGLEAIQHAHPSLDLGSYPFERPDGRRGVALVAKGTDQAALETARQALRALIAGLGREPIDGEPAP